VTTPAQYPVRTRLLHWLTAVLIFSMLLIGFAMVSSLGSYATLRSVHMTLGVTVLVIVVLRVVNRFTHRVPKLPDTVGWLEHKLVLGSELMLYALMLAQPLVGWAMVSATGKPVVIFGSLNLPRIAPFNADLYFILRQTHSLLAYALVVVIAAHVSAVLLHTLTLRDGMLSRMTFARRRKNPPADSADSGTPEPATGHAAIRERTDNAHDAGRHRRAGSH
jgi:cytochrome b561